MLPLSLGLHLALVHAGLDVHLARVLSFVAGTALVSVLHRRWTFRSAGGRGAAWWMALLSATAFAVVVLTHGLALAALPSVLTDGWVVAAAWVVSQGLGTTVTFAVLRGALLRDPVVPDDPGYGPGVPEPVGGWTIFGERSAYDSPWMRVKLVDVEAPEGKRFDYHVVELSRIAVALIVDPDDRVLLLWKYRFPADQWGYEAPGGMVDEGESPLAAAAREAAEETGWRVTGEPEHLLSLEPLPGQVRARVDAYLWRGATRVGGPTDPAEDGVATWVDLARVPELVARGQILGAATAAALMYVYGRR